MTIFTKQSSWNSTTRHFTTRKFSTSPGLYQTCSTPLGPLSTFEIVHGPHHYWRIRCLSRVWSGTTLCSRVRTILALGYWVLPNISQYWLVLGIGQYFYWLSYPIPIPLGHLDTSCQQMTAGKLGRM